ncbi:MAG: LysM peptidoglycan-binding domain-containing protein [Chloroflexi bacterium]|nr:LysM peptidoglycan-binding domain-containing protein [Chloroflexota bacterium]
MQAHPLRPNMAMVLIAFAFLFGIMIAAVRLLQPDSAAYWNVQEQDASASMGAAGLSPGLQQGSASGYAETPTPDQPHALPPLRTETEQYVVQPGDTLAQIAKEYGVSLAQIVQANQLTNPDLVEVGVTLIIPPPNPQGNGPEFKIIPDSELVYGPGTVGFDTAGFIQGQGGFLASYSEEVEGRELNGAQIVQRVAEEFSVNPRILLAVLEYQSGWVTQTAPQASQEFPLGWKDPYRVGLYRQLAWAANQLNRGFYLWRVNGASTWVLADGSTILISPLINAGTAGVQHLFANLYDRSSWEKAVTEAGVFNTFNTLFGSPFALAVEPLLPADLTQPTLQLPFEPGQVWSFTGGPHGGWGDGSAWASLDFAPPGEALGCVQSDHWVVAMADGLVVRTGDGVVMQDLDGDGYEQTGWALLYMHIESRDRVAPGTYLRAGDRVGHPSCEGGVSTGTHVHIARKYNGEWIPADQDLPFNLDGWISAGTGYEYNGTLHRNGQTVEAYAGRSTGNGIQR